MVEQKHGKDRSAMDRRRDEHRLCTLHVTIAITMLCERQKKKQGVALIRSLGEGEVPGVSEWSLSSAHSGCHTQVVGGACGTRGWPSSSDKKHSILEIGYG